MAGGEEQPNNQGMGGWQYRQEGGPSGSSGVTGGHDVPASAADDPSAVEWTAAEFIAHQKSFFWYVAFVLIVAVVTALMYFFTKDSVSTGAIVMLGLIVGIAAVRKPRVLTYRLDRSGLTLGQKFHPYGEFKSFAIVHEDAFASITLLPIKRFALPISVYFSPEDEQRITEVIGRHLPLQPGAIDSIDRLLRSLHF